MALVPLNARAGELSGKDRLRAALDQADWARSVTVMTHGYRFSPDLAQHCPHSHILSENPNKTRARAVSWPRHLRLRAEGSLGIALGWHARGALWQAYAEADKTGGALADLLQIIANERPGLRVNIIAHSLGARVALSALSRAAPGQVSRIALLTGAEFRRRASQAMAQQGARGVRVLNVTSGENRPFDWAFQASAQPGFWPRRAMSGGLTAPTENWCDLQIDAPRHRQALAALDHHLPPPARRYCHWSTYLRPGVFEIYRQFFGPEGGRFFAQLRAELNAAERPAWSWPSPIQPA